MRCYHSRPEWTWVRWQWRGTLHSPKLHRCWNLTIRLFSVIYRILVRGGVSYPSAEMQSVYSTAPADWAILQIVVFRISVDLGLITIDEWLHTAQSSWTGASPLDTVPCHIHDVLFGWNSYPSAVYTLGLFYASTTGLWTDCEVLLKELISVFFASGNSKFIDATTHSATINRT